MSEHSSRGTHASPQIEAGNAARRSGDDPSTAWCGVSPGIFMSGMNDRVIDGGFLPMANLRLRRELPTEAWR